MQIDAMRRVVASAPRVRDANGLPLACVEGSRASAR
jgi:hypothetical protein